MTCPGHKIIAIVKKESKLMKVFRTKNLKLQELLICHVCYFVNSVVCYLNTVGIHIQDIRLLQNWKKPER